MMIGSSVQRRFGKQIHAAVLLIAFHVLPWVQERAIGQAGPGIIKGQVVSEDQQPLPGVTITNLRTKGATYSRQDGHFSLEGREQDTLQLTHVGYETLKIFYAGQAILKISLRAGVQGNMEEVKVVSTGYQNIDRRVFTGATAQINAEEARRSGVPDVSRMLEGQAAGVSVQNVSGSFGAAPKIRVRGATSITGDNKPLWVIDGVVLEDQVNVSNDQLSSGDVNTLLGSSVAGLNPDDIAEFQILKDAAATALYGARAMNGVIVVKTKSGRAGPPRINYTGNLTSYRRPDYNEFDIMTSYDQMSVMAELERKGLLDYALFKNTPNSGPYGKLSRALVTWENGRPLVENTVEGRNAFLSKYVYANTDWFQDLFNNSLMNEHSVNISGGVDKTNYYFSTSYLKDNGWTIADRASRFTFNGKGSFKINDRLTVGLKGLGSIRDQRAPGTLNQVSEAVFGTVSREFDINPFSYAMNTSRVVRARDEKGALEYVVMNHAPFNIIDELSNNYIDLKLIDLSVQGELQYKLPFGIEYNFLGSYRYLLSNTEHKVLDRANMAEAYRAGTIYGVAGENSTVAAMNRYLYIDPANADGLPKTILPYGGLYMKSNTSLKSYYFRNSLSWDKSINRHFIKLLGTQELRYLNRVADNFRGYGFQYSKGGVPFIDPDAIKREVEGSQNYYGATPFFDRFVAVAAAANYSFDRRYQLAITGRYDGSNQLGNSKNARWLPTWSVSGSWNIDQENFMKENDFVNILTLRGTYGLTASMGAATNAALWLNAGNTKRFGSANVEPSLEIRYLANNDLTWEKQYETNIGLDATFLKRFTVALDLYHRNGFDLINGIYTSGIDGEGYKFANHADMKSKGIELLLRAGLVKSNRFSWTMQWTNAYTTAKITRMINRPNIWNLVSGIGGAKLGYPHRGLFSIDFQKLDELVGTPNYIDQNGALSAGINLQSIITDYLVYEGPVDPTFTGGLSNMFQYKNWELSALVTYSGGNKVRLTPRYKLNYSDLDAYSYDFITRFLMPNESLAPSVPDVRNENRLPEQAYNAYNYSTTRVADGSFIRLKQVRLSYNLADRLTSKIGLRNVSLSLAANNPLLIYADKKLNGQDPEFYGSGGVALPIPKQYTLSVKASL